MVYMIAFAARPLPIDTDLIYEGIATHASLFLSCRVRINRHRPDLRRDCDTPIVPPIAPPIMPIDTDLIYEGIATPAVSPATLPLLLSMTVYPNVYEKLFNHSLK